MKSWMDRFTGTTREKIDWLRYHRFENFEVTREKCNELIAYGETIKDDALLGFAYFYIGQTYYFGMQFDQALKASNTALQYLEKADAPLLLIYCYDQIGCIYTQYYTFESAADYFLKAKNLAEKQHHSYALGNVLSNLGNLYFMLSDYARAKELLGEAFNVFKTNPQDPATIQRLFYNKTTMVSCRLLMNELHDVEKDLMEIKAEIDAMPNAERMYIYYYVLLFDYYVRSKNDAVDQAFSMFVDALRKSDDVPAEFATTIAQTGVEIYESGNEKWISIFDTIFDKLISFEMTTAQKSTLLIARYNHQKDKHSDEAVELADQFMNLYRKQSEIENQSKLRIVNGLYQANEEAKKVKQWEEMANSDSLTGLPNRRAFEQEYQNLTGYDGPAAVGMIDVDQFKEYNDNYGHMAGDEVLVKIGQLMKDHASRNMTFYRFGGDEFVFIAKGIEAIQLVKHVQLLITDLECLRIKHEYSSISPFLTLSIGISFHNQLNDTDMHTMTSEADQELYAVKHDKNGHYKIRITK